MADTTDATLAEIQNIAATQAADAATIASIDANVKTLQADLTAALNASPVTRLSPEQQAALDAVFASAQAEQAALAGVATDATPPAPATPATPAT